MKIPKELVEQWLIELGETHLYRPNIEYIAQRAAEWALQQPVSMEPDWKRLYELEKKKKQAIYDKYERDIAKLPRIVPMDAAPEPVSMEPVAWATLHGKAQAIVEGKPLWKRFIDGTPLSNDIACWMADFALENAATPAERRPLTDEQIEAMWNADTTSDEDCHSLYFFKVVARAIEAAHGIKEQP